MHLPFDTPIISLRPPSRLRTRRRDSNPRHSAAIAQALVFFDVRLFLLRFFNCSVHGLDANPDRDSKVDKTEIKRMCGKFTQMMSWAKLHDLAGLVGTSGETLQEDGAQIRTPMRFASVIRLGANGRRETVAMRWGFADARAKAPLERPRHIHARAETIDVLPTFANAFAQARGLVLVKSFNVGEELPNGKVKQWAVTPRDGKPLALAVIYGRWTDRNEGELLTFVMATVPANSLIARVTDRMPAVVSAEHWAAWLGETAATTEELKATLVTADGDWDLSEQAKPEKRPVRETAQRGLS